MITLVYPREGETNYLIWRDLVIGPIGTDYSISPEKIEYRSIHDLITEKRGIYHENDVDHWSTNGEITYLPIADDLVLVPSQTEPCKTVAYYENSYGNRVSKTLIWGHFVSGQCKQTNPFIYGIMGATHVAVVYDGMWHMFACSTTKTDPTRLSYWIHYEFLDFATPGKARVRSNRVSYGTSFASGIDWSIPRSFEEVAGYIPSVQTITQVQVTLDTIIEYDRETHQTPRDLIDYLEGLTNFFWSDKLFPKPMDWGDLAMKASERTLANQVNMIAFLKDLRHPASLIPKLKNLSKLKTWANNYLAVEYGVLPTVSDLQEIRGAMNGIKAYVDRNNFDTFSADHRATDGSSAFAEYSSEQHIKLAIDEEDDGLDMLVQQMESFGVWPSFQNIWDLVPYSFVVDWFINIGNYLERVDGRHRLLRLNIRYVTMSHKRTLAIKLDPNVSFLNGTIQRVHYHRWVSDQCPVPVLSLQPFPTEFNHWLESGALLIQRRKH